MTKIHAERTIHLRRRMTALVLLFCILLGAVCARAEGAEDITAQVKVRSESGKKLRRDALDGQWKTYQTVVRNGSIILDAGSTEIGGILLQFYDRATATRVDAETASGWVTVDEVGKHLTEWCPMPAGTKRVRLANISEARMFLAEVTVYGTGPAPADAARWEDLDKADLLLAVCHPDDELLWFGGLLPVYAGERGLRVQVVYAVPSTPERRLELLGGFWHCGVTAYPVFCNMPDVRSKTLKAAYSNWNKNRLQERLTGFIRRFRPDVVVTQDFGGEYGHGAHRALADSVRAAVKMAPDSSKHAESARMWGTWEVKKFYVHLYEERQIRLDWHQPLARFDGRDGFTVAEEALNYHVSQVSNGWAIEEGGSCDNTLFGLYATTVGEDILGGDLMENIIPEPAGEEEWIDLDEENPTGGDESAPDAR